MIARRLQKSLARRVGERAIFRENNGIGAGDGWIRSLKESLTGKATLLVPIVPD